MFVCFPGNALSYDLINLPSLAFITSLSRMGSFRLKFQRYLWITFGSRRFLLFHQQSRRPFRLQPMHWIGRTTHSSSSVKFLVNIVLDMLIITRFHFGSCNQTVSTQEITQLYCNLTAAYAGMTYFVYITLKKRNALREVQGPVNPSFAALRPLLMPDFLTFVESAVCNALYLG